MDFLVVQKIHYRSKRDILILYNLILFQIPFSAHRFLSNYKFFEYERFHRRNPTIPVFGAETSSVLSTRGEYFFPLSDHSQKGYANFQVTSYDIAHPTWANTPDTEFKALDQAPYAFGEFVWTGFDYLGEPTPYNSDASNLLNFSDPADRARAIRSASAS